MCGCATDVFAEVTVTVTNMTVICSDLGHQTWDIRPGTYSLCDCAALRIVYGPAAVSWLTRPGESLPTPAPYDRCLLRALSTGPAEGREKPTPCAGDIPEADPPVPRREGPGQTRGETAAGKGAHPRGEILVYRARYTDTHSIRSSCCPVCHYLVDVPIDIYHRPGMQSVSCSVLDPTHDIGSCRKHSALIILIS